jgi:hypothetical protein
MKGYSKLKKGELLELLRSWKMESSWARRRAN